MPNFIEKLVAECLAEEARFKISATKNGLEMDDPYYKYIGQYWSAINQNLDGRSVGDNGMRIPWSAAFISYVVRRAGAGNSFLYADAHHHYIRQSLLAAEDGIGGTAFIANKTNGYAPKVGDLLAKGRGSAKQFTYATALEKARQVKADNRSYDSHCDVVVAVNLANKTVSTIGGNVSDSVTRKDWKTDGHGFLLPRKEENAAGVMTDYPWIAVLACRI
jgi:hypothetical protein